MKTILVTGHAGFIGSNLVHRLFCDIKEETIAVIFLDKIIEMIPV